MSVTETSKESFEQFSAASGPALSAAVLRLLEQAPKTIEELSESLGRPQSTISGVLRPLVKDGKAKHLGFSESSFKKRVRTWARVVKQGSTE